MAYPITSSLISAYEPAFLSIVILLIRGEYDSFGVLGVNIIVLAYFWALPS